MASAEEDAVAAMIVMATCSFKLKGPWFMKRVNLLSGTLIRPNKVDPAVGMISSKTLPRMYAIIWASRFNINQVEGENSTDLKEELANGDSLWTEVEYLAKDGTKTRKSNSKENHTESEL
jgi:hypothetical protein